MQFTRPPGMPVPGGRQQQLRRRKIVFGGALKSLKPKVSVPCLRGIARDPSGLFINALWRWGKKIPRQHR